MGTETRYANPITLCFVDLVKLNNPLMGTETVRSAKGNNYIIPTG